jgi:hypothetical protein
MPLVYICSQDASMATLRGPCFNSCAACHATRNTRTHDHTCITKPQGGGTISVSFLEMGVQPDNEAAGTAVLHFAF